MALSKINITRFNGTFGAEGIAPGGVCILTRRRRWASHPWLPGREGAEDFLPPIPAQDPSFWAQRAPGIQPQSHSCSDTEENLAVVFTGHRLSKCQPFGVMSQGGKGPRGPGHTAVPPLELEASLLQGFQAGTQWEQVALCDRCLCSVRT